MSDQDSRLGWRARVVLVLAVTTSLVAAACSSDDDDDDGDAAPTTTAATADGTTTSVASTTTAAPGPAAEDRAYYVLPPGNFGGLPTTDDSLDQLPLYDGLTPLRDDVDDADLEAFFLPAEFEPVGETVEEPTPRPGTTILYDEYGVAHITGVTRDDVAFGAGWVAARDRAVLLLQALGPARAAVADVPGIDAFGLVTSGRSFVPSAAAEQLVADQVDLLVETYGEEGEEIVAEAGAYAEGMNAYWDSVDSPHPTITVNDIIAITAFIGSIFGAGGGAEATNSDLLAQLQDELGLERGQQAWDDVMLFDDPEAPTTIDETFDYGPLTGGEVTGSVVLDAGSTESYDPLLAGAGADGGGAGEVALSAPGSGEVALSVPGSYAAAGAIPTRRASNWLLVDPERSENGTTLGVMGPQLGYYYPEIVQQLHLTGPDYEVQGAAVPGLGMYLLIGHTADYAWSLTSATHDVRDVFVEVLCEPDGGEPTRTSAHYEFDGECVPFETFDAGTLDGAPVVYPVSGHGPVIGTATWEGRPVALSRQRSTFGRDGLNLKALKDMTEGDAATADDFFEVADQFGFTFNWGYVNREGIAYFSSGRLPERAAGLDRRLPTLGTGEYEWQGFLALEDHPHADGHPSGRLLNWNNQSAPGFMHGDDEPYGSVQRVELFDQFPDRVDLAGTVGVMNRSATEDIRSPVWPVISEVLRGGEAPSPGAAEVVDLLDAWVADDAPRLDGDDDGFEDTVGPAVFDALWRPLTETVVGPVFGDLVDELDAVRPLSTYGASIVDKDLRTLLGAAVEGPFNLAYCGAGDLDACRDALWATVDQVAGELAATLGDDPATWLQEGQRTTFVPGLIPDDFRTTNRPTFQQLVEFAPPAG